VTSGPAFVSSRGNALLVRLRKLARHPGDYRKDGQVLLEGEHLCQAWAERGNTSALQAVVTETAWKEARFRELAGSAQAIVVVADALWAQVGTLETPAPIAFLVPLPPAAPIVAAAPSVVLDRLQDAGNVGSILRSAAAFGFTQVIALQGTASLWSGKVLRAAMGAHLALHLVENADADSLETLTLPWLGTSSHADQPLPGSALPWPCVWLFGNEGSGLRAGLRARCALELKVPQPGGEESLNVAAAAAICLYESARRRPEAASRRISPGP
jgi:TrmH family RNA methyltransferase